MAFSLEAIAYLLRPSSIAATSPMALASPIPWIFISSFTESLPSSLRLSLLNLRTSWASSRADLSRVPWLRRIAINSELLNEEIPLASSFSLGRSSFAHSLIEYLFACIFKLWLLILSLSIILSKTKQTIPYETQLYLFFGCFTPCIIFLCCLRNLTFFSAFCLSFCLLQHQR